MHKLKPGPAKFFLYVTLTAQSENARMRSRQTDNAMSFSASMLWALQAYLKTHSRPAKPLKIKGGTFEVGQIWYPESQNVAWTVQSTC